MCFARGYIYIHRDEDGSVLLIIQSLDFIKTKSGDEGSIVVRFLYSWPLNMEGERQKRATAAHKPIYDRADATMAASNISVVHATDFGSSLWKSRNVAASKKLPAR